MDALIVLIIGGALAYGFERKSKEVREVVAPIDAPQQMKRKNPDFIKHEDAFMSLYNNIMKGN